MASLSLLPISLLSFLVFFSFLSNGAAAKGSRKPHRSAQERDKITALPGEPVSKVNFNQYSGYISVDNKARRSLFYWLIESPSNASSSKPLVLWLNGGPGCSSIAYGASEEVGPFRVSPDGKTLTLSPFAWNSEANLLFLDSPAGVGFSYSDTTADLDEVGDKRTGRDAYMFLTRWMKRFPQYKRRPFYIAGESYAGHFIPELALLITRFNKGAKNPIINFKGFLVSWEPLLDDYLDNLGSFEYWYNHGLISDSSYKALNKACLNQSFMFPKGRCNKALFKAYWEFGDINPYDIYGSVCADLGTFSHFFSKPLPYKYRGSDECVVTYTKMYMNRPDVQKALHVKTASISQPWRTCSDVVRNSWTDSPRSMLPTIKELIASGIRVWVFSGDTDAVLPLTATRYSINDLKLKTLTEWYPWYENHKVGGWTQVYEGLTYVTVRGAGHEVPLTSPKLALLLFRHFLTNQPMPQITTQD